ncbi:MAG: histone deacetylase, partial [Planctomycetes bacterium]|nr:histone deacetylase [Planctomycetota bacterium]
MNKIAVLRDPLFKKHSNGPDHPEGPQRLEAIDRMLADFPFKNRLSDIPARDATEDELGWVHDRQYIKRIEQTRERSFTMLDPDTGATSHSYAAAVRAAGGTIEAVRAILSDRFNNAFAFVRPPGHHAEADRAMGFCLFNNAAIAAQYAIHGHGLNQVLILDWDVHHGNGTMHSFYDSKQVLYFSVHQYPHYPGTGGVNEIGNGAGKGYTVNVPLDGGQGDSDYMAVFRSIFQPIAREFAPQLMLISAGFDAHGEDPLASMRLSSNCYGAMTAAMKEVAEECCKGRIAVVLEGGYNLSALSEGVASVLLALLDQSPVIERGSETGERYIDQVIRE